MEQPLTVGQLIVGKLESMGITAHELSLRSGIDNGSLYKVLHGKVALSTKNALKLSIALDIDVEILLVQQAKYQSWVLKREQQ